MTFDQAVSLMHRDGKRIVSDSEQLEIVAGAIWWVESGYVDLFFRKTQVSEATRWVHLMSAQQGELLLGIDRSYLPPDVQCIAKLGMSTTLIQLNRKQFDVIVAHVQSKELSGLLDNWFAKFTTAFVWSTPPSLHLVPGIGTRSYAPGNSVVLPAHGINWFRCEGGALFCGRQDGPHLDADNYFPVTHQSWLCTVDDGDVWVRSLDEIVEMGSLWPSFDHFQQVLLSDLDRVWDRREEDGRARIERRSTTDVHLLKSALLNLTKPTQGHRNQPSSTQAADPLLDAFKLVGRAMHLQFRPPPSRLRVDRSDPLGEIARASRVRHRQVVLEDNWWSMDNGPLLGWLKEGERPVALLPLSEREYSWVDPSQGDRGKVNAQTAHLFRTKAYQFYRPLDDSFWGNLFFLVWSVRNDLARVILFGACGGLLALVMPFLTAQIFDSVIPQSQHSSLLFIGAGLLVTAISSALFSYGRGISLLRMEGKLESFLQHGVWDRLLSLPVSFFKKYSAGDLVLRAMGISSIRILLTESIVTTVFSAVFSVFNVIIMFYYDVTLSLVALGICLLLFCLSLLSMLRVRYERRVADLEGRLNGLVYQFVCGISKLRVSGSEIGAFASWAKIFSAKERLIFKSRMAGNVFNLANEMVMLGSQIVLFMVALRLIDGGKELSLGEFLGFMAAYGQLTSILLAVSTALVNGIAVVPYGERLLPILKHEPETAEGAIDPGRLEGGMMVSSLQFRYSPDTPPVLNNISFTVQAGEFLAIVGPSGSGKSTLLRLLLGLEKPELGAIYYNGKELASLDLRRLRRQIGVVLQGSEPLSGSILSNIVGPLPLSLEDAWQAVRMVGLAEDIQAMPMGIHTRVGDSGSGLSGGQRQRILLARALVGYPRILFLDEATSALDNQTQAVISQVLDEHHVTRIVIAHRLSTVRNADRILVLKDGAVVETGTFESLIASQGVFARLVAHQVY